VRDGDLIRLDAVAGTLEALVAEQEWASREPASRSSAEEQGSAHGLGRELFAGMRRHVASAEEGAVTWL
jgi:phosphogluconate dehydratase